MQSTSNLYNSIIQADNHWFESSVVIGEAGRLLARVSEVLLFGGTAILTSRGGGDSGYQESSIFELSITSGLFADENPTIGNAISSEIHLKMMKPSGEIPRMAQIVPYVRVTDGTRYSEWIQKGVFYIDTREYSKDVDTLQTVTLHGYDAMLLADKLYDSSELTWNAKDIDVLNEIASKLSLGIDSRTITLMNKNYYLTFPAQYTLRETLSFIASAYGGNFIINELGQLRLVPLWDLLAETRYLVTSYGDAITFGGDRILV